MVQTGDEAPLSTEPQARMSSDDKASTSAIMLQLQLMQEEQKKGQQRMDARFDELRDKMKQERNELRNELRSETQQLRSEQSTLKAQVMASITSMEKHQAQLLHYFTFHMCV